MYEVMVAWETMSLADQPRYLQDYAEIWRAADKMVYSRTLDTVSSARTRIEREFDPEAVRRMKATAEHDISMAAGILPLRRSNPAWSTSCTWSLRRWLWEAARGACPTVSVKLELLDERRFGNGMAHLHHRTTT